MIMMHQCVYPLGRLTLEGLENEKNVARYYVVEANDQGAHAPLPHVHWSCDGRWTASAREPLPHGYVYNGQDAQHATRAGGWPGRGGIHTMQVRSRRAGEEGHYGRG